MALNIKDPSTDRIVRELAEVTGESITTAVKTAVEQRLAKVGARSRERGIAEDLNDIALRYSRLPVRDERSADEIIGYDEHGLPA